jgi:hypothetical protein
MTMARKLLLILFITFVVSLTVGYGAATLVDSQTVEANSFTTGTFSP